jgi:hypothetical protein
MRSPKLWIGLSLVALGYVFINLLFVNAVTIIHHVTFEVTVHDAASGEPIPAAQVAVLWNPEKTYRSKRELGLTDPRGLVTRELVIQEQPPWAFPKAGVFKFRRMYLQVEAQGYRPELISVAAASPAVPFAGRRMATVSVALKLRPTRPLHRARTRNSKCQTC